MYTVRCPDVPDVQTALECLPLTMTRYNSPTMGYSSSCSLPHGTCSYLRRPGRRQRRPVTHGASSLMLRSVRLMLCVATKTQARQGRACMAATWCRGVGVAFVGPRLPSTEMWPSLRRKSVQASTLEQPQQASTLDGVNAADTNSNINNHVDAVGNYKPATVEAEEVQVIVTTTTEESSQSGRQCSIETRRKIAIGNKGKTPRNKGRNHSQETREKIAEGARKATRRRKQASAASMGLTLEEYEEKRERERSKGPRAPRPAVTAETRAKISQRMLEKWKDPVYRAERLENMPRRLGSKHTEGAKERIKTALTLKWEDPEYRGKLTAKTLSAETRLKISRAMRAQWADPGIRKERTAKMCSKTEVHKKRISESLRAIWAERKVKREKVPKAMPPIPEVDNDIDNVSFDLDMK